MSVSSSSGGQNCIIQHRFLKFSIPKCYNIKLNTTRQSLTHLFIYSIIYVRATCFDLVGHPQALQENQIQEFFFNLFIKQHAPLHSNITCFT